VDGITDGQVIEMGLEKWAGLSHVKMEGQLFTFGLLF
jgi:hypothetical protein